MEVLRLNMDGLEKLLQSEKVKQWQDLPISPLRLNSQSRNPSLRKDDIIMILLLEDDNLWGYMGAMPDEMIVAGNDIHVAWGSCIWINNRCRGKGLGKMLTEEMNDAWNNKLILSEFTEQAKRVYDKTGLFEILGNKKGVRYFYKAGFYSIAKHRESFRHCRFFFRAADKMINFYQRRKLKKDEAQRCAGRYKEIPLPGNLPAGNATFKQSPAKDQWIFNYPWLTENRSDECKQYYFTTRVEIMHFRNIQFFDKEEIILGELLYSNINNHCKILRVFCSEINKRLFAELADRYFFSAKVESVLCFDKEFNDLMSGISGSWFYKKIRNRTYLAGKKILTLLGREAAVNIQETDGDIVFT